MFSDLLYVVIKRLRQASQQNRQHTPRLILMSATFNTDLFAAYFSENVNVGPQAPKKSLKLAAQQIPKTIFVGYDDFLSRFFIWKSYNNVRYYHLRRLHHIIDQVLVHHNIICDELLVVRLCYLAVCCDVIMYV